MTSAPPSVPLRAVKIAVRGLDAWFGEEQVLRGIDIDIAADEVTAVIGPSGCGKSTFIRCLNRMHELTRRARVTGEVCLDGQDVYGRAVDPVTLRRRVGMVFQEPNPFPSMSIAENVLAGFTLTGTSPPTDADDVVRFALEQAALWEEVRDRLDARGTSLSGGQQQRLCIARAIAVQPEVLLMDEPCSSLDPIATAKVEDLIQRLTPSYTVVVVTHNMRQAARISDRTAFFLQGELIEYGATDGIFTHPRDPRTEDYVTGKFG